MIIDLTDDPRADLAIADNIGSAIGGYMNNSRRKKQLTEQKEKKQLQQGYTIQGLNSGLQGRELHAFMNNIPGWVESDMAQSFNQKQLESRASGQGTRQAIDKDVADLGRLTKNLQGLYQWDGVQQQHVLKPGAEVLKEGIENAIKNTVGRITAAEQARKAGVEDVAGAAKQFVGGEQPDELAAPDIDAEIQAPGDQQKNPPPFVQMQKNKQKRAGTVDAIEDEAARVMAGKGIESKDEMSRRTLGEKVESGVSSEDQEKVNELRRRGVPEATIQQALREMKGAK